MTQKRPSFDSSTCIGSGRLEEMAEICRNENIDRIVFDCELTATQIRKISRTCAAFSLSTELCSYWISLLSVRLLVRADCR